MPLVVWTPFTAQFAQVILQFTAEFPRIVGLDAGAAVLRKLKESVVVVAHEQVSRLPRMEKLDSGVPVGLHGLALLLGGRSPAEGPKVKQVASEDPDVRLELFGDLVENLDHRFVLAVPV